jgi:hypothetical protein
MIPEPETIALIRQSARGLVPPGLVDVWECGCSLRISNARGQEGRETWRLCQYHEGFDHAIEVMRSLPEGLQ